MGRIYTARGEITTFTGNGDMLQIQCASNKVILLHDFHIGQSNSETDDSSSVTLNTRTSARTGGSTIDARPKDPGDAADSATVTEAPTTDPSPLHSDTIDDSWSWSALAGLDKIYTPETRPVLPGGSIWAFKFSSTISSVTLEYSITFEEIG